MWTNAAAMTSKKFYTQEEYAKIVLGMGKRPTKKEDSRYWIDLLNTSYREINEICELMK